MRQEDDSNRWAFSGHSDCVSVEVHGLVIVEELADKLEPPLHMRIARRQSACASATDRGSRPTEKFIKPPGSTHG
jgi:hypothetical protein